MLIFLIFLFAMALVGLTIFLHARTLGFIMASVPKLAKMSFRRPVRIAVFGCFLSHIIHIFLYAAAYFVAVTEWQWGSIAIAGESGVTTLSFMDFIYFSAVSYTTLGFGDLYALGGIRMIVAVEALNGLLMMSWTASFTFLMMERFGTSQDRSQI